MIFQQTTALNKILALNKRIRIIQGGTSASKTISILQILIDIAQTYEDLTITVGAESVPHLKKGAMKDFLSIMQGHKYYSESEHNKTDYIYKFKTGSYIEFFGVAENPGKARGPRRDILFLNECNNIPYSVYEQMEIRTRKLIFLDYNPVSKFWVHDKVMAEQDYDFVQLTYRDNEGLEKSIIKSIEARRLKNPNWYRVFGLGEVGVKEGQIYTGWKVIPKIPEEARLLRYGVDFGYTNHPSAIIAIYKWNDAFIWHQICYEKGMSNRKLANVIRKYEGLQPVGDDNSFKGYTDILAVADSAEPKSIDEIKSYGVKIKGAEKGKGSRVWGIEKVQDEEIYVTASSTETLEEKDNYLWKTDRDGNSLNEPDDAFDHAMDAGRYGQTDLISNRLDPRNRPGRIIV